MYNTQKDMESGFEKFLKEVFVNVNMKCHTIQKSELNFYLKLV